MVCPQIDNFDEWTSSLDDANYHFTNRRDNQNKYMLIKKRGVEKIILEEFSKGRFIFGFSSRKVRRTKI